MAWPTLIFAHTFCSFSVTVHSELYKDATDRLSLDAWLGNAFSFAGRTVASNVKFWMLDKFPSSQPIEFIFERGDDGEDELREQMRRDGYSDPIFRKKCEVAGLQAADILAWEIREDQKVKRKTAGEHGSDRPLFKRFFKRSENWQTFNKVSFDTLAQHLQRSPEEFETLLDFKRRERREKREKGVRNDN